MFIRGSRFFAALPDFTEELPMFPKFSVRKPFTVLVAVILVIVLGVVSYINMTPDLLPEIDLPYVVVMTTYIGATPEEVESVITRPVEQSLATLDHIESLSSTSGPNYSLIMLQFSDDANLDYVTMAIREKLDMLGGSWDDNVGTPSILKLNMDLLPVTVAAVSRDGYDTIALSTLVEEELLTRLEGVEGVARITATGLISQQVEVKIDRSKLDAINVKLRAEVERQLDEKRAELDAQKAEAQSRLDELQSGRSQLTDGKSELTAQQKELTAQLSQAQLELDRKKQELLQAKLELVSGIGEMEQQLAALAKSEENLRTLRTNADNAAFAYTQATAAAEKLTELNDTLARLDATRQAMLAALENLGTSAADAEAALADSEGYAELTEGYAELDAVLTAAGLTREGLPDALEQAKTGAEQAKSALATLDAALAAQGLTRDTLPKAIEQAASSRTALSEAKLALSDKLAELERGEASVEEALAELADQQAAASRELSGAMTEIIVNEKTLESTVAQLEAAIAQIDDGYLQLDEARKTALESADIADKLTMSAVAQILGAQNFSMPAGYADGTLVRIGSDLTDVKELENLLLFDLDGVGEVRLCDVADVTLKDNASETYARINGRDSVLLTFSKQSGYATATVSKNIAAKLADITADYDGLKFDTLMDQGDYIRVIIGSVLENLFLGGILAILILLFFLRDLRPTFVIACAIPLSVTFAIVLMYFSGVTLNIISLSGLAIGVGMLVDNSIVVIENIYQLRNRGVSPIKAAVQGTVQVTAAITASTLTTVAVFLPIVFLTGLTRQLFTDMALTITYSLMASLIVALTMVPCVAAGTFKRVRASGRVYNATLNGYEKIIRWSLAHKWAVILAALVFLGGSAFWALSRGFSYMPDVASTQVMVTLEAPEGSALSETAALADEASRRIREINGVKTVGAMLSSDMANIVNMQSVRGGNTTSVTMYVLLDSDVHLSMSKLADEIETRTADMDCKIAASSTSSMSNYAKSLGGEGVIVRLYGSDLDTMRTEAVKIANVLRGVDGVAEVSDGLETLTPELRVKVNRDAAMKKNLTTAQIYMQVAAALTENANATTIPGTLSDADVLVFNTADIRPGKLGEFVLTYNTADGQSGTVRLGEVSEILETTSFRSINRDEQRRYVEIGAAVAEGKNVTLVTAAAERAMKDYTAPTGCTVEFSGESATIEQAIGDLVWMLLLGVLIVYLIMVAQFQSLLSPLIVMFVVPLAFTGGFAALAIFGFEVSMVAMLGFIILVGVVVNNGIVLVDCINQLRAGGMERTDAVIEACRTRLRPVLMTALTTVLGLLPMSLGIGLGVTLVQPIAVASIGGLTYATLMTLVIVPVFYDGLHKKPLRIVTREELEESEYDD